MTSPFLRAICGIALLAAISLGLFFLARNPSENAETKESPPAQNSAIATPNAPKSSLPFAQTHSLGDKVVSPDELLSRLESLSADEPDLREIQPLLQTLVRLSPLTAARFADNRPDADLREVLLHRVAQYWTQQDSHAAVEWVRASRHREQIPSLMATVCQEIAQADPLGAIAIAQRYQADTPGGPLLQNLVQQWARQNFQDAEDWTATNAPGPLRDELFARLALVRSTTAPAEAAQIVSDRIYPGSTQEEAAISVLHQWQAVDPAAAAEWVHSFPEGPLRERALQELSAGSADRALTPATL